MDALLIVARTLHFAATAALEGTFVFWCFIARPAFRQVQTARALEAQLDRRAHLQQHVRQREHARRTGHVLFHQQHCG